MLQLAITRLVEVLDRQLESERLTAPDGKPANRPRQLAFAGLWDIYAGLTSTSLPATPPDAYLNLCAVAFPELGLDTVGLEEAAERLFKRAQRRQRMGGA